MNQTNKPILCDISLHNLLSSKSKKILEDEGLTFVGAYLSETKDKDGKMNQKDESSEYCQKLQDLEKVVDMFLDSLQALTGESKEKIKNLQDLKKILDKLHV